MDTIQGLEARSGANGSPSGATERAAAVLIVGGGAAGITVAAALRRHRPQLPVTLVEPSGTHAYQPGWTLVGAGVFSLAQTLRREETLIPKGITWIRAAVAAFHPDENQVEFADGRRLAYRHLVVCPGLQLDWDKVEGLRATLGSHGVCSNYSAASAEYTWKCLQEFRGGTALFTQPPMPIKCAGAPQKIMYLAADRWRRHGLPRPAEIEFCLAGDALFGVPFFVPPLQRAVDDYGIGLRYRHTLKAVHGPSRTAHFTLTDAEGRTREVEKRFDLMHVTPPQSAPDFVKASPLANGAGWVEVDPATLRHARYANVFSLGDAAGTSNAKTAAAVRLQAPVVVRNLLAAIDGRPPEASYDGYGSCPLITGYGKVVLAEFTYGGEVTPSFPLDPRKPRRSAWLLKTKLLPFLYWNMMLRGSEFGVKHRARRFAEAHPA
ncbi:FAD/NAD(P)-binding oxidoreductase [Roseomonas sp. E05]|uniref:NAD(P)/FAD-dependent oxidoreductase n=1 Tax=Roseomonas sp. E05 TaxID=3046310 RepID=UPI0024BB7355|nr:FAD/NAD(P)-binding oxidoreductase [Roseomonas sp. E05]MDJ0391130.1 FAD/NAD(P)-binding oxidoreductase [Roseomonas sp. E05]